MTNPIASAMDRLISARAVRFSPVCFYPYRVVEGGKTYPLVVDCSSLDEAINAAQLHCFHKDHLLVREVGEGVDRLHLYAIKKRSAPTYVYRDYQYQRQDRLYAAPVCVMDMRFVITAEDSRNGIEWGGK